ncbi:hypothetical protein J4433_01755 [Candidatus Pacearchaeota archaeon]|nr:hypothetical protein [Candidatus Pacearchaeota archaeon]
MQIRGSKTAILNKKAQVALFVIIAVVIVAGIALFFSLRGGIKVMPKATEPQAYVEKCMEDYATDAIQLLTKQGGTLKPLAYATYDSNKINYLCYTSDYYSKCVNQQPMLKYSIEEEITSYTAPKVQACVSQLKSQLEKKGYIVKTGNLQLQTTLQPKKVIISASIPLTISKEETKTFENFQAIILSPIYEQAMLAQDIVNSEISYGDYDQLSYMLYKSNTDIEKKLSGEATIYMLKERGSGQRFLFATRSYVMPPGF